MVVKLAIIDEYHAHQFESSVISYGSQTAANAIKPAIVFESSVISYGSQTHDKIVLCYTSFESSGI